MSHIPWFHLFDEITIYGLGLLLPVIRLVRIYVFGQRGSEKWDLGNLIFIDALRGAHIVPMIFVVVLGLMTGAQVFGFETFTEHQKAIAVDRLWLYITLAGFLGLLQFKGDMWTVIELKDPRWSRAAKKKTKKSRQ